MTRICMMMILVSLVLVACGGQGEEVLQKDGPLQVLATTGMVGDLVRNVGGEHVDVSTLMGPGVDPHLYKASAGDLDKLQRADVIFYNGLELEGKMEDIFTNMRRGGKPTVALGAFLDTETLLASQQYEGRPDPHIWFDVSMWASLLDDVAERLGEIDPDNADAYVNNALAYSLRLKQLHQWAKAEIARIDENRRVLITAHDAFQYFGAAYDIDVVGLQGISTASEYGPRDIERIVNIIVERSVKAVFIESSVPRRSIEAVVEGARQLGQEVSIGGELYSDAMGEAGTPEGTYIGMVRHNINTIVDSLQ